MKKWVNELESHSPQGIILTIAGNKADLENQRKVRKEDAQKFAKSHNASHFLVSAKNGLNINAMFKDLADRIAESKASSKTSSKKNYKNPRLTIEREKPRQ